MDFINAFFTGLTSFLAGLAGIVNKIEWGTVINDLLAKIVSK